MSPFLVMLLASIGPVLVGFFDFDGDTDDQSGEDDEALVETDEDPVEIVDVASFIDDARLSLATDDGVSVTRGTDEDEEYVAEDEVSSIHDASGGDDTLTGSSLNDTLSGGEDSDVIEGGDGDDALFGAFSRETRADDEDADTLDGGAGDDILFLGDGDTGTGGEGNDIFVATQDAAETVEIEDFDVDEDIIAVESETPEDLSIVDQAVEDGSLRVEISSGLILRLEGVTEAIPTTSIQFVEATAIEES